MSDDYFNSIGATGIFSCFDDGEFKKPEDIAINSKRGAIYVTDTGNSRIEVFGNNSQK
jgi:DNA-binding beta-propeller fold protein YncE